MRKRKVNQDDATLLAMLQNAVHNLHCGWQERGRSAWPFKDSKGREWIASATIIDGDLRFNKEPL